MAWRHMLALGLIDYCWISRVAIRGAGGGRRLLLLALLGERPVPGLRAVHLGPEPLERQVELGEPGRAPVLARRRRQRRLLVLLPGGVGPVPQRRGIHQVGACPSGESSLSCYFVQLRIAV